MVTAPRRIVFQENKFMIPKLTLLGISPLSKIGEKLSHLADEAVVSTLKVTCSTLEKYFSTAVLSSIIGLHA